MKITHLNLHHIAVPLTKPYKLAKTYGTLVNAHAVIVKMHTDDGRVGLGEANPMMPFTDETPASVMAVIRDIIAPLLIGQDPTRIAMLESLVDQSVHGNLTARGAINMALYDILGKANNVPVHILLGGMRHRRLPLLFGAGSGKPEEDITTIGARIDEGCCSFMLKMGALVIADEIKRLIAVKKRFGDNITILVDANQGWERSQALQFIEGIKGFRPDLIEQPIPRWDIEGLRRIRECAPCPLSADESLTTVHDAVTLIRERAVDVFSIKVSKNGGLDKAKQIAMIADGFGLKCLMNSMLEFGITQAASLQLGCTLPNLMQVGHAYGSVLRLSDDITDFGRNIARHVVTVPNESGLGVTLNEEKLRKYTVDYFEI